MPGQRRRLPCRFAASASAAATAATAPAGRRVFAMAVALGAALRYTGTSRGTPMAGVGAAAHAMESNCSASPIPRAIPAGNGKEDPFVPPDADTRTTRMPHHPIGLGTYLIEKETIASTLRTAIQIGYRRIDCAPVYFNEDAIGDALAEILSTTTNSRDLGSSNNTNTNNKEQNQNTTVHQVTRSDLFVVSKLPSPFHRNVEAAVRKTLSDLRMEYLDLYLVHWPVAFFPVAVDLSRRGWANEDIDDSNNGSNIDESVSIHETWSGMEDVVRLGLVRNIGVSNMPVLLLHEVLSRATIPPAVNQVELHPYLQQQNLLSYCHKRGVHVQGYSPLGTPGYKEAHEPSVLNDVVLQRLAAKHGVTVAQIALSWALQRGVSVVVKSISPQHLSENLLKTATTRATSETTMLHSILLCDDEMAEIATLDRGYRFFRPQDWWGDKAMAVFD